MANKTVTVMPSGGDYTTLAAAIAGEKADLTAADYYLGGPGILNIEISGTWSAVDASSQVSISNADWVTSADYYINIYTTGNARHAGVWSTSKHILAGIDGGQIWVYTPEFVRIDGLQIDISTSSSNRYNIYTNTTGRVDVSNCILKGNDPASNTSYYFYTSGSGTFNCWNNIAFNMVAASDGVGFVNNGTGALNVYNCTILGADYGVRSMNGTTNVKNTYCGGSASEDFYRSGGTLNKTNCASEDQSADDTGTGETASNCVAAAVAVSTDNFTNVTGGSEDYRLPGTGSALYHTGVDTSGEASPLDFDTDICGDSYYDTGGARSIGADEYVAAAASTNIVLNII